MSNPSEHALSLVRSLLNYCDIDPEGLEEENQVLLSIDYELSVFIVIDRQLIHLLGTLGSVHSSEALYRNLLAENFQSCTQAGYVYSIEPQSNELLMSRTVQSDSLDAGGLIDIFDSFVRYAEDWSAALLVHATEAPQPRGDSPQLAAEERSNQPAGVEPGSTEHVYQSRV